MIALASKFEPASESRIAREVANSLVGAGQADDLALDFELARMTLWALTRDREPVHILRLMNTLMDAAKSLSPARDEQPLRRNLREVLDELADTGDVLELPGGHWHPAAVREVELGQPGVDRLLIGGLPTSVIPAQLQGDIVHERAFRRLRSQRLCEALALPVESFASWSGAPPVDLVEWANSILASRLATYTGPSDNSHLRIYAPNEAHRGVPQHRRWRDLTESLSGRFLADRVREFGRREFRIVELHTGRIEHSSANLLANEVRRFMYALDLLAENPVEVSIESGVGEVRLTLWSELPRPELRLFGALGALKTPLEQYYPRRWCFAARHEENVRRRLRALGVRLSEKRRGRR